MNKLLIALLVFASLQPAFAKNEDGKYDSSPFKEWFETQHNSKGEWCCNDADGHMYDGDYSLNADGSVTIPWNAQGPIHVDASRVLTTPNPTGHAVWWYLPDMQGRPNTFCFSPGQLG